MSAAARPLAALLAGLAQAASIALPGSGAPLWWLQIASLAVLAWLLRTAASARAAALTGWLFATTWLAATFWWLFVSLHTYGGLAAPLAALAVLALAAFLGGYYAMGSWCFWRFAHIQRALAAPIFAFLWLLAELARGQWWTGFPWGAGGYAHLDGPLAPLAPLIGVYGVGLVAALLAALLAQLRRADLLRASAWITAALLAAAGLGAAQWQQAVLARMQVHAPLSLALLQGNIPQDEKFQPGSGVPLALAWYGQQMQAQTAQLVVAPETAIPLLPDDLEPGYLARISQRYRQGGQALLLGMPLGTPAAGYTNSVLGYAAGQGAPYRYDKHHLVPFGEFIPPLFRWFTALLHIPLGDFNRGAAPQPPFAFAGERIAPNICYEDLFGEELALRFADARQAPTLMVNLSNIAWFGDTLALEQHLAISRMRALEFARPMVRATNTGMTAVIDHHGQVQALLAPFERAVLQARVRGVDGPGTPYARWAGRWGLAPLWIAALLVLLAAALMQPRRNNG
ncbi:apolipoprotein N-acyltransferase [Comamonas flocculans]|uniref:Apolipoprotein N-acyltransferase n=1 Tax=Comamonas flocculans TaxID=2597701 RepID=A0A5B8RUI2_9BURK|nr:apolipoprotein N-acyltransferase [Comamonas flocculans]QEA13206.1 apolipoprotein N-acyltransferase [Comamonas flocculans]